MFEKQLSFFLVLLLISKYAFSLDTDCSEREYEVAISGKIYEISDLGVKTPFRGRLDLQDTNLYANVDESGSFEINDFISSDKDICEGSKVKFKLDDPDLFILSPFAGDFYLPRFREDTRTDEFQIRVVRKYSRFYQTLARFDESIVYAVQVAVTSNEGGAIDIINKLNNYSLIKTGDYFAYYEPHMRSGLPNNGYIFKVKIGAFTNKDDAEKIRNKLTKLNKKFSSSFITVNVRFYQ